MEVIDASNAQATRNRARALTRDRLLGTVPRAHGECGGGDRHPDQAQDRPADEVLVYPAKFVHPGDEETLLRANGIKVVGVCAADSSQIKIGPVQDGGPQRVMTVYSDSHTRGFVHGSTKAFITMASGPPDDRGNFNAFTNNGSRGSLDGSFVLTHGGGGCGFEASAIAS
jgi:hypothetical protein